MIKGLGSWYSEISFFEWLTRAKNDVNSAHLTKVMYSARYEVGRSYQILLALVEAKIELFKPRAFRGLGLYLKVISFAGLENQWLKFL